MTALQEPVMMEIKLYIASPCRSSFLQLPRASHIKPTMQILEEQHSMANPDLTA
jgi:hypothetical protein